jgi:hypothetical protein
LIILIQLNIHFKFILNSIILIGLQNYLKIDLKINKKSMGCGEDGVGV